ncbi:MAG TPA: molybdenum cofactor guanylyltransferase [Longimicrobium sp.]|jgi:molybdopterin-guanine dinucleotide biosynthesis protein A|nr:molybdenum cofactor guanylyltransferase [Longimicrobium sp.]
MTDPAHRAVPASTDTPLGAILAGGASRRFGSPKALAMVGGRTIVERVRDAIEEAVGHAVLITNEPELFAALRLPSRPDVHPGAGPVAGIEVALRWAEEEGRPGALVAACDVPFLDPRALRLILDVARSASPSPDAVTVGPGDGGRPPLCAYFSIRCLPAVERVLAGAERSVRALLSSVTTAWVPTEEIARFRDPEVMFFNVNAPDDLRRAEQIARELDERA